MLRCQYQDNADGDDFHVPMPDDLLRCDTEPLANFSLEDWAVNGVAGGSDALGTIEWIFTALFTIEYVARLICVEHPRRYARSFFGIVDLLAVMPTYLALFFPELHALIDVRIFVAALCLILLILFVFLGFTYSTDRGMTWAEAMGLVAQTHDAMFRAIHIERSLRPTAGVDDIVEYESRLNEVTSRR